MPVQGADLNEWLRYSISHAKISATSQELFLSLHSRKVLHVTLKHTIVAPTHRNYHELFVFPPRGIRNLLLAFDLFKRQAKFFHNGKGNCCPYGLGRRPEQGNGMNTRILHDPHDRLIQIQFCCLTIVDGSLQDNSLPFRSLTR